MLYSEGKAITVPVGTILSSGPSVGEASALGDGFLRHTRRSI